MDIFIYIVIAVLGLIIGSFCNVLIYRLPEDEQVTRGRSHCRGCGATICWKDNIPLLSYILLKGKCRACGERISLQYPLVELACAALFILAYVSTFGGSIQHDATELAMRIAAFVGTAFAFSSLVVIFGTDLREFIIPDAVVLPASAVALVMGLANTYVFSCRMPGIPCGIGNIAWSLVGTVFFLSLVLGSRGAWMGLGDVKLAVFMGFFLGLSKLLVAMFLSFTGGSLAGIVLLVTRKKTLKSEVPFGVFLAPATIAAYVWGEPILRWAGLLPFRW